MIKPLSLLIAIASLIAPATALAIVNGSADGSAHPSVGMITVNGYAWCTGTLVTPTKVLSAAHCADVPAGALVAANFNEDASSGAAYPGTFAADPVYAARNGYARERIANDVSVITLDAPVVGIRPTPIAPAGYLDALSQKQIKATTITLVGYGAHGFEKGVAGSHTGIFDTLRRQAGVGIGELQDGIMRLNTNKGDNGGACYGDSGGPALLNGYVVSVTSNGSPWCQSWEERPRVDQGPARAWLSTQGALS